jgi:hypothetical protein
MSVKNCFVFLNLKFFFIKNLGRNLGRDENVDYFVALFTYKVAVRCYIAIVVNLVVAGVDRCDVTIQRQKIQIAVDRAKTQ